MTPLRMRLTGPRLEQLCDDMIERSRTLESALAGLNAIDVLITLASHPDDVGGESFEEAKRQIATRSDALREQLVEESGRRLARALAAEQLFTIVDLHDALSRGGFQEAARRARIHMEPETREHAVAWTAGWCEEARRRAAEASPFPDAYNFRKAGIDPAHYGAMEALSDLLRDAPR